MTLLAPILRRMVSLGWWALVPLGAQGLPVPGTLAVTPTYLRFDSRTRNLDITLKNTGDQEATYRIGFQHLQMREDGSLEPVETLANSAAPLIRHSPRQVVLAPGESQRVRLQVRKPENLAEGEYRIHLLFRAVPPPGPAQPPPEANPSIRVELTPIPGVAIPVDVIHGKPKLLMHVEGGQWSKGETPEALILTARLVQEGQLGFRGTLQLVLANKGKAESVLASQPIVHYGDLPRQQLHLPVPVSAPPLKPIPPGPLRLVLADENGKAVLGMDIPQPTVY